MSTISCFFDVKRKPLVCASSVPVVFFPLIKGRIVRSAMRGIRWSRIFTCRKLSGDGWQQQKLTSFSWGIRSASSAAFAACCLKRFRSSWIIRWAAVSRCDSRLRYSISLMNIELWPCCSINFDVAGAISLEAVCPGVKKFKRRYLEILLLSSVQGRQKITLQSGLDRVEPRSLSCLCEMALVSHWSGQTAPDLAYLRRPHLKGGLLDTPQQTYSKETILGLG